MMNINEMLRQSELRTDILTIADYLNGDPDYTKEDAVQDLLKFLERHNL